ncbi:MAG: hypothetical protein F6J97_04895 [Leptolyngbya sp. SIO4C1]|nr:hypothetical protein [Leptolyngbya sp. SIO4C1]
MSNSSNPFIGNPFMQGTAPAADPAPPAASARTQSPEGRTAKAKTAEGRPIAEVTKRSPAPLNLTSDSLTAKASPAVPAGKASSKSRKQSKQSSPPLQTAQPASGYRVQVLAKIPLSTNTNLPSRDYLWFAVYPIIPRVGDCLFHDGRYFRVDAVFLYENTTPSWCADIEVSYYPRRR